MVMKWHAIDRFKHRWYPYLLTSSNGNTNLLAHHEGDDTDMGDLYMHELVEWRGPLVLVPNEKAEQ